MYSKFPVKTHSTCALHCNNMKRKQMNSTERIRSMCTDFGPARSPVASHGAAWWRRRAVGESLERCTAPIRPCQSGIRDAPGVFLRVPCKRKNLPSRQILTVEQFCLYFFSPFPEIRGIPPPMVLPKISSRLANNYNLKALTSKGERVMEILHLGIFILKLNFSPLKIVIFILENSFCHRM